MSMSLAKSLKFREKRLALQARQAARALVRASKHTLVVQIPITLFEDIQDLAAVQDRYIVDIVTEALALYRDHKLEEAPPSTPCGD